MRQLLRWIVICVRELFWIGAAGAIIVGGYVGFQYLGDNSQEVAAEPAIRPITSVATAAFELVTGALPIRGDGFVAPFRTVALSAPVGGRIVSLHPAVTNRGKFIVGDVLVEIDASVERAQILQANAAIAATKARLDLLDTQLTRANILFERKAVSQAVIDDFLGQQEEIFATLEGQKAQLTSAEIALENKIVRAPFSGSVQTKFAEVGNVVAGGSPIAQIYTEDRMEVSVAIRESDAALIPGLFEGNAAPARVYITFAGAENQWNAEIVRVDPSLDPQTRTLTATVALTERTNIGIELASGAPPALINAFAHVVIDGIEPSSAYAIPSTAMRNGNTVWILRDDTLNILPASLIHVDGETSFVSVNELLADDRLILTTLAAPQPGRKLRSISDEGLPSLIIK